MYLTELRRTFELKIGFIKEVDILHICLILFNPFFDQKLIIDNDSNFIVYHQDNLFVIVIDILYFDISL